MNSLKLIASGLFVAALASCSHDRFEPTPQEKANGKIVIQGDIKQINNTKATATGFTDGDQFAVYIVDYDQDGMPSTLATSGNRADNLKFTFSEPGTWTPDHDVYWRDEHTAVDVYGYYPTASVDNVNNLPFEIAQDQNKEHTDGSMSGYEVSDFLWGKVSGATAAGGLINILFEHKMACARIRLVEGEGFEAGEWANLQKDVIISNTARKGSIDLATGIATPTSEVQADGIIPQKDGNEFRAVVMPQTIGANTKLFSITVNGVNYIFRKTSDFDYVSGRMHNFDIEVTKKEAAGDYVFNIVSESITAWEIDKKSHDGVQKEYVLVKTTAGHLREDLIALGKEPSQVKNLKITGTLSGMYIDESNWSCYNPDFDFIKNELTSLEYLNIKDVVIDNGVLPEQAFSNCTSLFHIYLPENGLTEIGGFAFEYCSSLTGSLIIPEGVTRVGERAFARCSSLNGSLTLPNTLLRIEEGAFDCDNFSGSLNLPGKLTYIGNSAFQGNKFSGTLHFPESLEFIGSDAFRNNQFTGGISIPPKISVVSNGVFADNQFNGPLYLHEGITEIGDDAFYVSNGWNMGFRGELYLPKSLERVGLNAFRANPFTGSLVLPDGIKVIGDYAFSYLYVLSGEVEIPSGIVYLGDGAFSNCLELEGAILPESLTIIPSNLFHWCYYLNRLVVKSEVPQHVESGAFDGVSKDNFVLEVPEGSVQLYRTASGWNEFKRISAHHELYCRPAALSTLCKSTTKNIIVNAEGSWHISSCSDWISVSPQSGNGKIEVTISLPDYSGSREGSVIFELDGTDYSCEVPVSQVYYNHFDGDVMTVQHATLGQNGGIDVVFTGDGFSPNDLSSGFFLETMNQQIESFFAIEPFKTYRDYFNVHIIFAESLESGVGGQNTIVYNRFGTTFEGGETSTLRTSYNDVFNFVTDNIPSIDNNKLRETVIVLTANSEYLGGTSHMWRDGESIAICPLSSWDYPYDQRGVVQHCACGNCFGKLGEEGVYLNEFYPRTIDNSNGWNANLSTSANMKDVGWSHLIFDPRYSSSVDMFEGGDGYARGIFRSEHNSCMNNNIEYFSTISRESIVRRIKEYAGETFDFEEFVEIDLASMSTAATKSSTNKYDDTLSDKTIFKNNMPIIHE